MKGRPGDKDIVYGNQMLLKKFNPEITPLAVKHLTELAGGPDRQILAGHFRQAIADLGLTAKDADKHNFKALDQAFSTTVRAYINSTNDADVYAGLPQGQTLEFDGPV